jgi:hypothetical protein
MLKIEKDKYFCILKNKHIMKYAVVEWYNYRKDLCAGFVKGFNDLDEAKDFAYKQSQI